MRSSCKRVLAVALILCALNLPLFPARAQEEPHTRPRRATPATQPQQTGEAEAESARLTSEPTVRIGLATDARAVNVSTSGRLLASTNPNDAPRAFELARVRVEPRSLQLTPPPAQDATPRDAEAASTTSPTAAQTPPPSGARGGVRLTSRAAPLSRVAVLYAPGEAKPLMDARAPVLFSTDDAEQHPVKLNEKPYRGRLEVFVNTRGTLTVVNVVALEDYVRGVVPNELSPGGFPEIEALKAQTVAARTYAVSNLGRFQAEGFDLTPDTRSQVYGGRSTEHPLTDRAVAETRGRVASYEGRPINALYTSTCGGRTEHAENIFGGDPVPYLRGRSCSLESAGGFAALRLRTTRELPNVKSAGHAASARDAALLALHGFAIPARVDDDWLEDFIPVDDVRALLNRVAAIARQSAPAVGADAARPPGFATALAGALDGESRGAVLLNEADVAYQLTFRDASETPAANRADVALMLREGHLTLLPDGTLGPRATMRRARVLRAVAHALEARALLALQRAAARQGTDGSLALRVTSGKNSERVLNVSAGAYLFRAFGPSLHAVREVNIVGGEQLAFHTDARGDVDYLEVHPVPSAAADRSSSFSNWSLSLTPSEVLSRLSRAAAGVGALRDLRVRRRGVSGRVLDLEVLGEAGTAHVRGGRVRTALGLREQLFVVGREFDEEGRVKKFIFTGRGWGHGVGMCQVGAFGMARAGASYEKILKHYYSGVSIERLY